jgi:hypothetical protein
MDTLTAEFEFTVMVMLLDVAGLPVGHVALDVSTQVTALPFAKVEEVKVLLFDPAFTPFTFH